MTPKLSRRAWILAVAGSTALAPLPLQAEPSADEMRRIEALLAVVAQAKGARFIRNGKEYSGADAADFLRRKLQSMGQDVDTAEAFIERIASRSSTTGQAYRVRFADGREIDCSDFLRAELARRRSK